MESDWTRSSLGEIAKFYSGGTPNKQTASFWGGDIPWISAATLKTSRISTSDLNITQEGLNAGSRLASKNDILLLVRGSALHQEIPLGVVVREVAFNQDVKALRAKPGIDPNFLFYQLHGRRSELLGMVEFTGIGAGKLDTNKLQALAVNVPSFAEQQRIAAIGCSLDDRIDHNRSVASNLEAIARRLFKSWFLDFDPVRAKAAGENPPGLADDIASLFPDRFLDSELGEIPEGWRLETLASVARLNPEAWTTRKHPDEIHYLDLSNVKDGMIEAPTRYSWEEAPSRARRVLQQGDTIIGTVRPGNRSFALIDQAGLTGSTGFAVLRPASDINREFLYLASTSDDAIERLAHLADGAAYPAVRPEIVLATEAIIPGEEIMKAFSSVTKGMIDRASVCKQEANALAGIRDLLLPRLISGKLRVEDAEFVIEEAIA